MNKIKTELKDCFILEPKRFGDQRGYFSSVTEKELKELGFNRTFQVSNSMSNKGIVRGLHYQKDPYCQAKVVRCHQGAVLDVVVDIRKDSPTYGKSVAVELTPENGRMLYVPRGFAHGFVSLKDNTLFEYYVDNEYKPSYEDGIIWNDPDIDINWKEIFKKYNINEPILSEKDKNRLPLKDTNINFTREPKKFLVTGVNGQLGYDIVRELHERGEYNVLAVDIDQMDITNEEEVHNIINNYKPDVIFHCAAWTNVDGAETPELKDKVYDVNVNGTKYITDASIEVGAKMIYMSTDYVFDGTKLGKYKESDKTNPLSQYGLTKYLGEEMVRKNPNHFITRISWVFGIHGKNFIKTMVNVGKTHDQLNVVYDQVGCPTYTVDLSRLLVEMAYSDKYGTYHVNNEGCCSWAELAEYAVKEYGLTSHVNFVTTDEYYKGKDRSKIANRPINGIKDTTKLIEAGFAPLPEWKDAVDRYLDELYLEQNGIQRKRLYNE